MQKILQAGLSSGMSATEGVHSNKPKRVDPSFDGLASLLPAKFIPKKTSQVIRHKGTMHEHRSVELGRYRHLALEER